MEKITVATDRFDFLLEGHQILVEDIAKVVGEKYLITDNNREQVAVCIHICDFHYYKKSVFLKSDINNMKPIDTTDRNDFKQKIMTAIKETGKPYINIRFKKSIYGETAWIYFGISKIAIDSDMFEQDISKEDFIIDYSQQSDLMISKLKEYYGENYLRYTKLKNI